jgi:hypothetical protein
MGSAPAALLGDGMGCLSGKRWPLGRGVDCSVRVKGGEAAGPAAAAWNHGRSMVAAGSGWAWPEPPRGLACALGLPAGGFSDSRRCLLVPA